jgi:hypothetical protein
VNDSKPKDGTRGAESAEADDLELSPTRNAGGMLVDLSAGPDPRRRLPAAPNPKQPAEPAERCNGEVEQWNDHQPDQH